MAGGLIINRASHQQDQKPGAVKMPKIMIIFHARRSGRLPGDMLACLGCAQTVRDR
jgi:hypothetical protein